MKSKNEKESDLLIMKMFRGRCVVNPSHRATEVNEIIPRSATKHSVTMKQNRVPMCRGCHAQYHDGGITEEKQEELRNLAISRLTMYGENLENW